MSALEISGLRVSYQRGRSRREVVHGVDLSVGAGETVALVGESGSGKSTTAHAVLGLLPRGGRTDAGRIVLGGTDISAWSNHRLRAVRGTQIGLIPQDPVMSLDPVRRIGTQVGDVLRIHGHRDTRRNQARVLELLERVGLDDPEARAQQYPHELSGGMRQRVLIAAAIALRPKLIIADEPTSALDATVQRRILDLIDDLRREEGTSVLLVTHDLGVAADRAAQVVVLRDGRVVEAGATHEVLASARDPYTRQLVADAPGLTTAEPRTLPVPVYLRDAATVPDEFAVDVRGLVREFAVPHRAPFRAVDDVSFQVRRGTTHAIVGESGSGKTTTARIMTRFETADAGSVRIHGQEITTLGRRDVRDLRRTVQLVYQNPFSSLDPRQRVGDIIAEPLVNFRIGTKAERVQRTVDLLERVALPADIAQRGARELSGGQRQRVAIARALAADPKVLVLDEAVSALDVTVQARILDLLDELQRELGLTYVFISHDLAVVRRLSHTVSVLLRGRVVESGDTKTIFENPHHQYTRELIAAVPGRTESVT